MAWEPLKDTEWERSFVHQVRGSVSLDHLASLYAWHGQHVAQITRVRERNGWNRSG